MWTPLISIPPPRLQHIEYAKTKSYATHRREDPDWVPPTSIYVQNTPNARLANGAGEKRQRDDPMDEDAREVKRDRTSKDADDDDDDDEEMEIEDDEDAPVKPANTANGAQICILSPSHEAHALSNTGQIPAAIQQQSARLMCLNLPQEVTDDVLAVLFQQCVPRSHAFH